MTKANPKDEKKPSRKNTLKEVIKQSVQPPPRAITPPKKSSAKKHNQNSD
jgi:hypothetical protein